MDLAPFVGQRVFLQFKIPLFLVAPGPNGPTPIVDRNGDRAVPLSVPFVVATIDECDEKMLRFNYQTDAAPGRKIHVRLPMDLVAFASSPGTIVSVS